RMLKSLKDIELKGRRRPHLSRTGTGVSPCVRDQRLSWPVEYVQGSHMKLQKIAPLLLLLLAAVACSRDPKTLVASGNKYFDRQKYKEASIMYRRAIQRDRKSAEAWYRLGLVDLKLGQAQEAAGALQRAVQLDPSNADAAGKLADIYFAASMLDAAHRQQNLAEVRTIAKELLRRNPHSFDGQRLSGYVAIAENRVADAATAFSEANRIKPDQP